MAIAFFDSGIGGLSVLQVARKRLPQEDFIYFADTLHVPYGSKSREEVKEFVLAAAEQLVGLGIKALVVACNTATSIAIKDLRARYDFPIIGMEPAVKPAIEKYAPAHKRVLVLATALTLKEDKYHQLLSHIDHLQLADACPMPGLVLLAEQLDFSEASVRAYLQETLGAIDWNNYGALVLGCTHFVFFRTHLQAFLPPHIEIIDGNVGTVNHLIQTLSAKGQIKREGSGSLQLLSSLNKAQEAQRMQKALDYLEKVFP